MTADVLSDGSPAGRIAAVLRHLGLERVHVAGCMTGDWGEFATHHADSIASLAVIAPHLNKGVPGGLDRFPAPAMIVSGDRGAPAQRAATLTAAFGAPEVIELTDFESAPWTDTLIERNAEVASALDEFFARAERTRPLAAADLPPHESDVAGIRYRVRGAGTPLLLLPLSFAPAQWDPLIDRLAERHCTITLGGPHLGVISLLEARARSGYARFISQVIEAAKPAPGDAVLEAGCGSGAVTRAVAALTRGRTPIVGCDINRYLLNEAEALTAAYAFRKAITYEEGDALDLPYADARFDVAICCTVMEEGDADRMLSELVRVTRPGGRVVAVTRALDVNWWANLPVPEALRARLNALGPSTGAGVGDDGCADSSLYDRVTAAGLTPIAMGPRFAIYADGERRDDVIERLIAKLPEGDARLCRDAVRDADARGTLFIAEPFHCAVCVKPD